MLEIRTLLQLLILSAICCSCSLAMADEQEISYSEVVQPILADRCFACHGADESSRSAGLRLDVRTEAIDFGAIAPGNADESEMLDRVFSEDEDLVMPPPHLKKPLTTEQKNVLKRWISEGANYEQHWAFQKPAIEPFQTNDSDWCKNEIDHFVLSELLKHGLQPNTPTEPHLFFRRLNLDITGLPPQPEETAAFLNEYREDPDLAVARWCDELMSRPGWGEHRARYWLDAARYADTHGLHYDNYREMWAYRDWVIRAFNQNKPFDEFTTEQLAGDLLESPSQDQLIATGFQRCNITTNEGGTIAEENLAVYAADRVQTFGWVYLGLTVNCCQCHDHKFDPLTMKDYYSLAAYFRNTTQRALDGNIKDGRGPVIKVYSKESREQLSNLRAETKELASQRLARRESAWPEFTDWLAASNEEDLRPTSDGISVSIPLKEGPQKQISVHAQKPELIDPPQDLEWDSTGLFGPAPIVNPKSIITLGHYIDIELKRPFTISFWLKTDAPGQTAPLIARMDEDSKHRGWDIYLESNELAVHLIDRWPENAIKIKSSTKPIKKGIWQHVCVTYDGSANHKGIQLFVDGKPLPSSPVTNSINSSAVLSTRVPLRVGQRSKGGMLRQSSIQNIRFFDIVRNETDIARAAAFPKLSSAIATPIAFRNQKTTDLLADFYFEQLDSPSKELSRRLFELKNNIRTIENETPVTHVQKEKSESMASTYILMRGQYDQKGEQVEAAPPATLHPAKKNYRKDRLGLAQWVVDKENPLTARVTVNRFWQEVFGQGLVTTPEDFGIMGSRPSHPKLLDWLALEFQEDWDVQRLFKLIFTSATYRQSSRFDAMRESKDGDNRLLSRGPRFRMDAEMIRDFALSTSDLLIRKMYGPGTRPYQPSGVWNVVGMPGGDTRNYRQDKGENLYRRSVYNFWKRMAPPANLEILNAPSREVCTVRRERTNTPVQALVTLNDPQFVEAAKLLAENALAREDDFQTTLDRLAQRLLSRTFSPRESQIIVESLEELTQHYRSNPQDAESLLSVGDQKNSPLIPASRLAAWTMICNQLLNLDEVLNK